MRRFYTQQIAFSCLIAGTWLCTIAMLTRGSSAVPLRTERPSPTDLITRRLEPRDESTGEVSRLHKFNDLGTRTEVEIRFKDKWRASVYFNVLGRRSRAVEWAPDGERSEYTFARDGKSLRRVMTYGADGVLKSDTIPVNGTEVRTTRFAADGKTKVSEQTLRSDGGATLTVFHRDGKTVYRILRRIDPRSEELVTHDERGVKTDIDIITRVLYGGGFMFPGYIVHHVTHTRLREDGRPAYKQQYSIVHGRRNVSRVEEYHSDGKTVSARFARVQNDTPGIRVVGQGDGFKVEVFTDDGTLQTTKTLRADLSVASVEDATTGERTEIPDSNTKELRYVELMDGSPARDLDKLPQISSDIGTHHLGQLLAD
ncbi:MAG: hypothetical protein K2W95_15250 [Candidatus Obscuribacterales bacterium]|nr:hypothetical protein [Candidatus Obscuribacterales bacterium]